MKIRLAFILLLAIVLATPTSAENWAQWRGPSLNGSTSETGLPDTWSKTENVLWTVKMPGPGQSTPIIWEDRVFVTAIENESEKMWAICLNRADGRELWKHEIGTGFFTRTGNSGASPSPIVDGERVYFLFGTTDFVAYDLDGELLWRRNIEADHGRMQIMFRYGGTPLLYQDKLYMAVMHRYSNVEPEPGKPAVSYLLCIDPKTGKDLWKQERLTDATGEGMEAYTTPYLFQGPNGPVIIVAGGDYITAHDPSDGKEVWRSADCNPEKRRAYRLVPSPVAVSGMIIACEPRGNSIFAIKGGGAGQLSENSFAWTQRDNAPDVCTPLVMDGKLFVLDGRKKVMSCLDPETGKVQWQGKLGGSQGFQTSPTGADGKIYCISMGGEVVVLSAGDEFEILSRIDMGEGVCRSTISAAKGQIFVRTAENLYCISKTESGAKAGIGGIYAKPDVIVERGGKWRGYDVYRLYDDGLVVSAQIAAITTKEVLFETLKYPIVRERLGNTDAFILNDHLVVREVVLRHGSHIDKDNNTTFLPGQIVYIINDAEGKSLCSNWPEIKKWFHRDNPKLRQSRYQVNKEQTQLTMTGQSDDGKEVTTEYSVRYSENGIILRETGEKALPLIKIPVE